MKNEFKMGMMALTILATGAMINVAYEYQMPHASRTIASEEVKNEVFSENFVITDMVTARKLLKELPKFQKRKEDLKKQLNEAVKRAKDGKSSYGELSELKSEYNDNSAKFLRVSFVTSTLNEIVNNGSSIESEYIQGVDNEAFSAEEKKELAEFYKFDSEINLYESLVKLDGEVTKAQEKSILESEARLCKSENLLTKMSEQLEELLDDKKKAVEAMEERKKQVKKVQETRQFAALMAQMIAPMLGQFQYRMAMPMAHANPLSSAGQDMSNFWANLTESRYKAYGPGQTIINNNYYSQNEPFFGFDNNYESPRYERSLARTNDSSRRLVPEFRRDYVSAETISVN